MVVNKVGIHPPYSKSFPDGKLLWEDTPPELAKESFFNTVNEYDSALAFNNDLFFGPLFEDPNALKNSVVMYLSDHGQNLGELDQDYSHCGSAKIEVEIPLVIMGNIDPNTIDFSYPAHHNNVFPTLLDIMNVPKESYANRYAPSLLDATLRDAEVRYFLPSGADFFTDSAIPYDE